ncbi:hypothetical protein [Sulfitobacter noctilucae]|uniref:hypothetical protein n=1 Tax=Sulfitobacter noctilucae TaxID=1342302 RepID=UPI001267D308|nr:hypothetical protein [Sulfitobacter noctilucae]
MSSRLKLGLFLIGAIIAAALLAVVIFLRPGEARTYATPGFENMTAHELSSKSYQVVPEMLSVVYLAFGETNEVVIYDKLAEVSAEDALETLYLERVGAMVGGGLDEADQTLHAMELTSLSSWQSGNTVTMDVKWHVVGTVGHATHLHVRGNTYSANLTVEPVGGAWRMTAFVLTDVDRSDAGTMVAAE